jgi:hypothetical protein
MTEEIILLAEFDRFLNPQWNIYNLPSACMGFFICGLPNIFFPAQYWNFVQCFVLALKSMSFVFKLTNMEDLPE